MKKKMIAGILSAALMLLLGIAFANRKAPVPIYINEVMSANGSFARDEDGEYCDWIEIYYAGEEPLSLEGYFLSDKKEEPKRWEFPAVVMEPDSYLLVYASGKDRTETDAPLHTNFKLSSAGETVFLSDADGKLVAGADVAKAQFDKSFGRVGDSGEYAVLADATPGEMNSSKKAPLLRKTEEIYFSVPAGYYDEMVYVSMETKEKDAEIYYTMDGSVPDETSMLYEKGDELFIDNRTEEPNRYTNVWCTPLEFGKEDGLNYNPSPQYKASVVKARMYFPKEECWSEDVWSSTYLIGADYTMPVVSLSVDEELLFDEQTGIYVPGNAFDEYISLGGELDPDKRFWKGNYSYDTEVPGHLECFADGSRRMDHDVTLRICGAASRGNPQKSFTVYAWGEKAKADFSSFRLRAFGNDWRRSMFRDALAQELAADLKLGTQSYLPCILLINGEYFGVYGIRENRDAKFFERHFGISEGNLAKVEPFLIKEESRDFYEQDFTELIEFVKHNDLALEANYEVVKNRLDTGQFIDYMLTEQYFYNIDWPQNNIIAFRSREKKENSPYEDGRWRFVLYDLDYALNFETENNFETIKNSDSAAGVLLRALMENGDFVSEYKERFEELLDANFEPSAAIETQRRFEAEFEPEIGEALQRWNVYYEDGTPAKEITPDYWREKQEEIRRFFAERPDYAREYFYASLP